MIYSYLWAFSLAMFYFSGLFGGKYSVCWSNNGQCGTTFCTYIHSLEKVNNTSAAFGNFAPSFGTESTFLTQALKLPNMSMLLCLQPGSSDTSKAPLSYSNQERASILPECDSESN